jgi:hypothetical protein
MMYIRYIVEVWYHSCSPSKSLLNCYSNWSPFSPPRMFSLQSSIIYFAIVSRNIAGNLITIVGSLVYVIFMRMQPLA